MPAAQPDRLATLRRVAQTTKARAIRARWLLVPLLAVPAAASTYGYAPKDLAAFGILGRALLDGHLAAPYASDFDQSGPLQLIAAAAVPLRVTQTHAMLAVEMVWGMAIAAGAMGLIKALRRLEQLEPSPGRELLGGLAALLVVGGSVMTGHLAELAIPVAWILSAAAAARGRWLIAGALLGAAVGVEPWAVLGLPVAILQDTLRRAAMTAATAVVVSLGCYLAFVLAGPFRLFQHQWPIDPHTLVHAWWPHAATFGWAPRTLQAVLAIGAGVAVVLALRRHKAAACWLAPLAICLTRLIFDPVQADYYWVTPQIAVIAGLAFLDPRRKGTTVGTAIVLWLVSFTFWPNAGTAIALVLVAALAADERRHQPRVASRWSTGTSSTLMPTMASPSPRETLAMTSGSS